MPPLDPFNDLDAARREFVRSSWIPANLAAADRVSSRFYSRDCIALNASGRAPAGGRPPSARARAAAGTRRAPRRQHVSTASAGPRGPRRLTRRRREERRTTGPPRRRAARGRRHGGRLPRGPSTPPRRDLEVPADALDTDVQGINRFEAADQDAAGAAPAAAGRRRGLRRGQRRPGHHGRDRPRAASGRAASGDRAAQDCELGFADRHGVQLLHGSGPVEIARCGLGYARQFLACVKGLAAYRLSARMPILVTVLSQRFAGDFPWDVSL